VPLSVLDLAPVVSGSTAAIALRNSLELVQHAERLGYHRYWVAEHHNVPGIASSSPPVLIAHLAAGTSTIRVGSGGVMLPNHASLVVAEQFGMLEALHPGRIDLGIGRAPGTDALTAQALRRSAGSFVEEEFPRQLSELYGFFRGTFPDDHPYRKITAVPGPGYEPDIWLLGSSDYSAEVAGLLGLPFSFAHHFAAANTLPALNRYRASFRPSEAMPEPYAMIAVTVVCADTEEQARRLALPAAVSFARRRTGRPTPMASPQEAADFQFTPSEREAVRAWGDTHVVGDPEQVRQQLDELAVRMGVNELMLTTMVYDQTDRLRSYQLVAEAYASAPV
jgi:luciferase family oxidoreductase group 1